MNAGRALLDSPDMQGGRSEVHLVPAQVHHLGCPQPMPVSDKDHGGVAVAVAVALGRVHELLDLGLREVLAGAQVAIGASPRRNCLF
jgi:hypothetical protein